MEKKKVTKNFWLNSYSKKAILFSTLLIYSFIIIFPNLIMPFPILLFGYIIIIIFFLSLYGYIRRWMHINEKTFTKKLFWHSFAYRLIFVGIMYALTLFLDPKSFPFEVRAADSLTYHYIAVHMMGDVSLNFDGFRVLNSLYDRSDFGFPIYLGIIYSLFGSYTFPFRLINCIWGSLSVVYISKMARCVFSENHARVSGIIAMLMPSFWWFGAMHLKETLMIFMIIAILYNTLVLIHSKRIDLYRIIIMIILSFLLFYFRTVLAALVILCILSYYFLIYSKNKFGNFKALVYCSLFILGSYYMIVAAKFDKNIDSALEQRKTQLERELTNSAKQVGISYKKAIVVPFIWVGAIVTPFPSFLALEKRQLGIYLHFYNEVIRNIMYFFTFLGLIYVFRNKFRESSLFTMFGLGWILILALAGNSFQDRFQLPSLPFMIILMSVGIIDSKQKWMNKWSLYLFFIFIAVLLWNLFKMNLRGLI